MMMPQRTRGNRRRKCQKFAPGAAIREYPQEEELADDGGEETKMIKS